MRSFLYAVPFLAAVHQALALPTSFEPPEVQEFVADALNEFHNWTNFEPSPNAESPQASNTTRAKSNVAVNSAQAGSCSFWLENIAHQGLAAFNSNPSNYQVYRNVKDFGAKGDGSTDDTAAINAAISSGGRCAPGSCQSSTTQPAVVYFPPGTYMISASIIDYYYTQMIGNPNCLPTIKAMSNFKGSLGMIDADPYQSGGYLAYGSTNVFWRQIQNFIIDTTAVAPSSSITGIHWPTGQATSIENVVFQMSSASGTQHVGIFIESGSAGYIGNLVFNGGLYGGNWGNQQFTMRNLTFNNVVVAINQIWDWSFTYKNIKVNNCQIAINMASGGSGAQSVGSVTLVDSTITNTRVALNTSHSLNSQPPAAGSLILENVQLNNVPIAVSGPSGTQLNGGTTKITGWGDGHSYTPKGPNNFLGSITPVSRPSSLLASDGSYYEASKPSYAQYSSSNFISARSSGATGNGRTDDTAALQKAINNAASSGKILFVDHGTYLVTSTIYIPAGSKIIGESYSVIMSAGSFFNDPSSPRPVVQVGKSGESGRIAWSEMIVSTQGQQQGAVLIEYNLVSPAGSPSGIWDVHTRIGGFAGSNLQRSQCPKTPDTTVTQSNYNANCVAAYMSMHITKGATGLYLENVWLWTADHDVEDSGLTQITVYTGRGLLDESSGPVWLVGTGVEHHVLYQYQFANAANVFAAMLQTETPYFQPNPSAPVPFAYNSALNDPQFGPTSISDGGFTIPYANAWGLRIVNSKNLHVYGAGFYSFFNNYSTTCSNQGNNEICQDQIVSIDSASSGITVYNLNTVGTHQMITLGGNNIAYYGDNLDGFVDTVAWFTTSN